ncbi:MAG: Spy/CpxP family protein refolding chaperone [Spirochaetes bacterium]|nr:Spy/CpxP family protein refolding chaperone [Spirochaetota bacterium]
MKENTKKIVFLSAAGTGILVLGLLIGHFTFGGLGRIYRDDSRFNQRGPGNFDMPMRRNDRGKGFGMNRDSFGGGFRSPGRGSILGGGSGNGMFFGGQMLEDVFDELDLSNDQQKKIESIIDEIHDKRFEHIKLFQDMSEDALKLLDKKTVTKEDVKSIMDRHDAEKEQFAVYYSEKTAEILNILDEKQKKEVKDFLSHFNRRFKRF